MNGNRILQTDSIQELADFWDTHDLTDFDAELEEVEEQVFDRQTTVTVSLDPDESRIVSALARLQGVSHAQLITRWVVERIHASSRSVT
ncbi:MAG: hypothetical protein F4047_03365 [Caldilineaceae bacterium SB0670_bin_27]|uniref:CopG family transcriptional regulator n=1 Tax=Caldilineaceae bacterium SB0664_bin_27 TaxID=2605260 RepID=A0A6B0YRH1_9CHLR|nr:hypothetical protein [Caldilineaceae bacterium SB0664_bin_27]MYJ77196.1 hypothetical protein [Caldilineaceae bacterium SB0670_bin_27]